MGIRRFLVGIACLSVVIEVTRCLAADSPVDPEDSRVVSAVNDIANVDPTSNADLMDEYPVSAAFPANVGSRVFAGSSDPRQALRDAVARLTEAGLSDEAAQVRQVLAKVEQDRQLTHEVDRLKRRLEAGIAVDQIQLSFMVFEVDYFETKLACYSGWRIYCPYWPYKSVNGLWDDHLQKLVENPRPDDTNRLLKLPVITAESSRRIRNFTGGELPVIGFDQDGNSRVAHEEYGTSVAATATIVDLDRIHLDVDVELKDLSDRNGMPNAGNARRLQSTFTMEDGATVYFGRKTVSAAGHQSLIIVAATARITIDQKVLPRASEPPFPVSPFLIPPEPVAKSGYFTTWMD